MHAQCNIRRAATATDSCFALIGAHQRGKAAGLMNPRLKSPWLPRCVQSSLSSARSSCWLGTARQFYHDMGGEGGSRVTGKLKQGAHMHRPTAWSSANACAQPDHEGSDSHGQLFRPYWGSSALHSRRPVTGQNPCTFCCYYYYYNYNNNNNYFLLLLSLILTLLFCILAVQRVWCDAPRP